MIGNVTCLLLGVVAMTRQVPSIDDGLEVIADNVHIWRFHNQAMPELGEVNHVALLLREVALDRVIEEVITSDDTIVYNGITHEDFVRTLFFFFSFFVHRLWSNVC